MLLSLAQRAQALVDGKNFSDALGDFDAALKLLPPGDTLDRARLLSGKGLALEGISDWVAALDTYTAALAMAGAAGAAPDPYILNSRGNCHASLGEWRAAREDYLASARGFQTARRADATLQQRLDGAVFSTSNAALMLAQLGDEPGAIKEIQGIARKAPGSADMRVALAALYWSAGQETAAEAEWEFACNKITVGCSRYQDEDWLFRIRRWPPLMVEKMREFLALRSNVKRLVDSGGNAAMGFKE
jgi:tetratricopeptide (TPR) repeat protein